MRPNRRRAWLATVSMLAGVVAVGSVCYRVLAAGLPSTTYWLVWIAFAVTFGVLSFRSAEVNDRQLVSSGGMVLLAAGTALSIRAFGTGDTVPAAVHMTLIAAVGFLSEGDIGTRRLFRPAVNFGLMTVAAFAAGSVIDVLLAAELPAFVDDMITVVNRAGIPLLTDSLSRIAVASLAGALVFAAVGNAAVRVITRLAYGPTTLVPWSRLRMILTMQVLQGWIGGLLGFVLAIAPSVALLPMVLSMFVVTHMAFSSQATLRSTHEAMLRGFVKILETRDLYTRGHTERVAEFALAIGRELGFSDTQLARLRWAALIHDVGKLAVPTAIMRKQGTLSDEEFHEMRVATHRVDDLLSEVEFLAPMVVICSGVHPRLDLDEDFGQTGHTHSLRATREQSILAVADAFDAMTSTRSYRMAMNQRTALERLTATNDPLFHQEVLAALGAALAKMPGSYGPPDLASTEVLRA